MEKIKIIEGTARDFEKQVEELLNNGWHGWIETHRMFEYCGKLMYSCVFSKIIKEEKK